MPGKTLSERRGKPPVKRRPRSTGGLSYDLERYCFHRALGKSSAMARKDAGADAGVKITIAKIEDDPLIQQRILDLQSELSEQTGVDMAWVQGEQVRQYYKADADGDTRAARLILGDIAKTVDYRDERRMRTEDAGQTEWDGLSDERIIQEIRRLEQIANDEGHAGVAERAAGADAVHPVHDAEFHPFNPPEEDGGGA